MRICVASMMALMCTLVAIPTLSAQEAAEETTQPAESAAAESAAAESAAAESVTGDEFGRLFAELKGILAELGTLQAEFSAADATQRAEIETKWKELVKKGDVLEPQLLAAAEKAFTEAPNADKQVTDLLVSVLRGLQQNDKYEEALRLGKLLIDNKCEDPKAADAAGIAAYATSDFETAEKYFALASKAGDLSRTAQGFLAELPTYKEAWAKEQEIRKAEAEADDLPRVLMKTNKGDIEIELFENEAPLAVANFVSLVSDGFYNGLTFHRVLPGFMAQGGCPKGDGTGGPGYNIPCECYEPNHRIHFRGSLSMAHAGRDTGGSQFFLTFIPTSHLNGRHTVFGRVISDMEVLNKLQRRDPGRPGGPEPDKIIEATVVRKRDHEYKPTKAGE